MPPPHCPPPDPHQGGSYLVTPTCRARTSQVLPAGTEGGAETGRPRASGSPWGEHPTCMGTQDGVCAQRSTHPGMAQLVPSAEHTAGTLQSLSGPAFALALPYLCSPGFTLPAVPGTGDMRAPPAACPHARYSQLGPSSWSRTGSVYRHIWKTKWARRKRMLVPSRALRRRPV